jgi:hypothetical protein
VILHKSVKEDLVLITKGSEESVLEDDRGLLLVNPWFFDGTWNLTYLEELVPCS